MAVEFIKGEEIEKKINKGTQIVVYYADWCGPCKMFAPILEEVSDEIPVFKVNVDEAKEIAKSNGVSGIPATHIYKDGKKVKELTGYLPKEQVINEAK